MIYLFTLIFGRVKFEFTGGFCESFLNDCFKNRLDIKNVKSSDGCLIGVCGIKTYKKLHPIARRHGGRTRVIKKSGLPFLLFPLKNRWGFFCGALAFVVIICTLSSFVWRVELVAPDGFDTAVANEILESNNLKSGALWKSIDTSSLSARLMSELDEVSWAHINRIGTTARVEINKTRAVPDTADEDTLKGIDVFRRELEVVTYRQQSSVSVKKQVKYKTILFYGLKLPLYFNYEELDISSTSKSLLTIKGVELPIGLVTQTQQRLSSTPNSLSDEELLSLCQKRLSYKEEQELDGYEIINKTATPTIDEDKCVIKASYIIVKN